MQAAGYEARVHEAALIALYRRKRSEPGQAWRLTHWFTNLSDADRDIIKRSNQATTDATTHERDST